MQPPRYIAKAVQLLFPTRAQGSPRVIQIDQETDLDVEWSDPLSVEEAWRIAKPRGGELDYEYSLADRSLKLTVLIPGPLRARCDGKITKIYTGETLTVSFRFTVEHSYRVEPGDQDRWSAFLDRKPERANYPERRRE